MSIGLSERRIEEAKKEAAEMYTKRGFQTRLGFGKKPALLIIDLTQGWTDPKSRLGTDLTSVVESTREVLEIARKKKIPIIFTSFAFDPSLKDIGLWMKKIPALADSIVGSKAAEIDPRIKPKAGEIVITKKNVSAFSGTNLASMLRNNGVYTIIVTGCSTSACVRATVVDGISNGFRPIVPRECVGDRASGPHEWNLFDIDAKFGDVTTKEAVIEYLNKLK